MTDNHMSLFCLVNGESTSSIFPVKLSLDDSIGDLKDLIKTKKSPRFDDVTTNELTIWHVSIPITEDCEIPILLNNVTSDKKKLGPATRLSKVFFKELPEETVHVILFAALQQAIKDHYDAFKGGRHDKVNMPLYLFLSRAGTGKSWNTQEFHQSALNCLTEEDDPDLRDGIRKAWVFNVTLKNGTSPLTKELYDPIRAIGSRMLLQLLPDKELYHVLEDYEELHLMQVLNLVVRYFDQDLKSAKVILVVDGLQSFMTDPKNGHDKDSAFYRALTCIGDLVLGAVFLMACCTATVTSPVEEMLAFTHQNWVVLPVASLKSPHIEKDGLSMAVFDEQDHVIKVLVSNCGGHGRALECLHEIVKTRGKDNVESLMNGLHHKLQGHYSEAFLMSSSTAQAMA
ncbi:hypothetical protein BG006_003044, partial [Podila minutissima]